MKDLIFFSHEPQLHWYAFLAQDLAQLMGMRTTLWVLGDQDRRSGEATGGYQRVVDLLAGFNRRGNAGDTERAFRRLRDMETRSGSSWYHQDMALDRWIEARKWSDGLAARFSAHILDRIDAELGVLEPHAVFGETNTLAYRLAYRRIGESAPYVTPLCWFFDRRFNLEDSLDWAWHRCQEEHLKFRHEEIPEAASKAARAALQATVEHQRAPEYHRRTPRGPEPWRAKFDRLRIVDSLRFLSADSWRESRRNPRVPGLWESSPVFKVVRALGERLKTYRFDRLALTEVPDDRPFACYFLHVQPEYTVEGLAPEYRDQAALVRTLAASLPADMLLLVKEHRPMIGRRAWNFHRQIAGCPNVRLLSDTVSPHEVLRHARPVATLTGTVALEALCFGKPAVVFGKIFYSQRTGDGFDGIYTVHSLQRLPAVLARALAPGAGASTEAALRALAAMYSASRPGSIGAFYSLEEMGDTHNRELLAEGIRAELELWFERRSRA